MDAEEKSAGLRVVDQRVGQPGRAVLDVGEGVGERDGAWSGVLRHRYWVEPALVGASLTGLTVTASGTSTASPPESVARTVRVAFP